MKNTFLQFESLGVQKLRRFHNLGSLYSRLYERQQFFDLLTAMARRCKNGKYVMGGAVISGSSGFDWKKERLREAELAKHYNEIDLCNDIKKKTITCKKCGQRLKIEGPAPSVTYCTCPDSPSSVYGMTTEGCDWKPFLERGDIIVWRREHASLPGMWEYKMYGSFSDVTADEFLSVQLDISQFRLSWDTSTAQCTVLDTDPATGNLVYYWEVNWPRFFSNRDYCCYREHSVDPATGTMLVVSTSTEHPACPSKRKVWRVKDYKSVMTIRPHTTSDQPGLEFSITGFENPGVQLPESIITWVAIRGMPEFMMNLREACIKLRRDHQLQTLKIASIPANPVKEPSMQQTAIYA